MKTYLTFLFLIISSFNLLWGQVEKGILNQIRFRNIGPAFMSGRIADIEKDPTNQSTWYVAVASGNVWKTENNGSTWKPIFENYGSFSTGAISIDPNNPNILWLGTGENQSQRSISWGDGIYKSTDAGKSWTNMGLKESAHIGKILVDPRDSDVIYIAAMGPLWSPGGERGVYKSIDAGASWEQVLTISENTGVADLSFDPTNPDILYAASYQRRRHVGILVAGGEESRIYKSTDAGGSWKKLSKGLPGGDLGRIAIAVSPQKSNVVYAMIAGTEKRQSGFYRSEDYGESWAKKNDYVIIDPQYYGEIYADPHQFDKVYVVDMMMHFTEDGGASFKRLNSRFKHVDNHEVVFDPKDPDYLMVGCDGGIYESWDKGDHWTYHSNLPITQFYRVGLDNDTPFYNVYGGTQDNSTLFGPSRTISRHGISNMDWKLALGGDGFQARIDPEDPNIVYCQSQYAGIVRYDRRNGQRLELQPQPAPDEDPLRWHWDSPLLISAHDSKRIYFAAQKVFRSDNRGDLWKGISGDLSRGEDRNERMVMGKRWSPEAVWKNVFTSPYGTIVAMTESILQEGILAVGTDDGLIQITSNGGESWQSYDKIPGVPERAYVADVFASQHNPNVLYAVFNNHKEGDFKPYVVKTENFGKNWTLITEGLEAPHACWTIIEDHVDPNLLFLGTEYGLFASTDKGAKWVQMKNGLPTIAVRDLEIQKRENDLVAATFGRGMYILDDYSLLRSANLSALKEDQGHIFPVKKALQYFQKGDLGYSRKGSFGDNFYSADNPSYGAVFRVYIPEKIGTLKEARKAEEKKFGLNKYPDAETLRAEDFELSPKFFLQISNQEKVYANIPLRNRKGLQSLSWDFGWAIQSGDTKFSRRINGVPDGNYTAKLIRVKNGLYHSYSEEQTFEVSTLNLSPEAVAADRMAILERIATAYLAIDELNAKIEKALKDFEISKKKIGKELQINQAALERLEQQRLALLHLRYELNGDQSKKDRFQYFLPGLRDRIRRVYNVQFQSAQFTQTHKDNLVLVEKGVAELELKLKEILE